LKQARSTIHPVEKKPMKNLAESCTNLPERATEIVSTRQRILLADFRKEKNICFTFVRYDSRYETSMIAFRTPKRMKI
jgi:hypothetical protein